ncbi:hypothetical protein K493DRAFT_341211, partial [Basidiobolus meristosporus CBS 931.73]
MLTLDLLPTQTTIHSKVPKRISMETDYLSFGRDKTKHYVLLANIISRQHAEIHYDNGAYYIVDFGSTNGTLINHVKIIPNTRNKLHDKDIIAFGGGGGLKPGQKVSVPDTPFYYKCSISVREQDDAPPTGLCTPKPLEKQHPAAHIVEIPSSSPICKPAESPSQRKFWNGLCNMANISEEQKPPLAFTKKLQKQEILSPEIQAASSSIRESRLPDDPFHSSTSKPTPISTVQQNSRARHQSDLQKPSQQQNPFFLGKSASLDLLNSHVIDEPVDTSISTSSHPNLQPQDPQLTINEAYQNSYHLEEKLIDLSSELSEGYFSQEYKFDLRIPTPLDSQPSLSKQGTTLAEDVSGKREGKAREIISPATPVALKESSTVEMQEDVEAPDTSNQCFKELESEITCAICWEYLVSAHFLNPCGHIFCGECISEWISANEVPQCPSCRVKFKGVPIASTTMDNIVSVVATRFLSSSEVEERTNRQQSWKEKSQKRKFTEINIEEEM